MPLLGPSSGLFVVSESDRLQPKNCREHDGHVVFDTSSCPTASNGGSRPGR
jgi:hypothetical protein